MLKFFDPGRWFWTASDGRVFSSEKMIVVTGDDADYLRFIDSGGGPTVWPRDADGHQTIQSVLDVLEPYNLPNAAQIAG